MKEEDFVEEEMLLTEWHSNYDTLKNQNQLKEQDSGSFWAGLFLARLIKNMQIRQIYR